MDMDYDFSENYDFALQEEDLEMQVEPEWMALNRQWTQNNPSVLFQKHSSAVLDGWVTLAPIDPGENLFINEEPMNLDKLFKHQPPPRKRSFMDKMDLPSLVEDPDNFNIDKLFADCDSSSVTSDTRKRQLWTKSEEEQLYNFINNSYPHSKIPNEAWNQLALQMGRSMCSLRTKATQLMKHGLNHKVEPAKRTKSTKPTINTMINEALKSLPNNTGTKEEIIEAIEKNYKDYLSSEANEDNKEYRWKRSVKQILCTSFKKIPGFYSLKSSTRVAKVANNSMNEHIIWALRTYGKLTRNELKCKIKEKFGENLNSAVNSESNLQAWEKTLLKKLCRCPLIDTSQSDDKYTYRSCSGAQAWAQSDSSVNNSIGYDT